MGSVCRRQYLYKRIPMNVHILSRYFIISDPIKNTCETVRDPIPEWLASKVKTTVLSGHE